MLKKVLSTLLISAFFIPTVIGQSFLESNSKVVPKLLWERTWGDPSGPNGVSTLTLTNEGSILVTGWLEFNGDIRSYNSSGNYNWNLSWNGVVGSDIIDTYSIGQNISYNSFMLNFNKTGNINWSKNLGPQYYFKAIMQHNKSLYATGGYKLGTMEFKAAIVKYDSNCNEIWNSSWHGGVRDGFNSLSMDNNSNFYAAGITTSSGTGPSDVMICKFNKTGNLTWNRIWGTPSVSDTAVDGIIDAKGNVYACGTTNNEWLLLLKYDTNGTYQWSRQWHNKYSHARGMTIDKNNSMIVCGEDFLNALVVKYDSDGNEIWNATWKNASSSATTAQDAVITDNGEIYVTGQYDNYYVYLRKYIEVLETPELVMIIFPTIAVIALFIVITKRK